MVTNWAGITPGGSRAIRSLFLAGFSHFALELCQNFLPVIYPLLIASMGLGYTQIGLIALTITLTGSILQPFFGFLTDRLGAERVSALSVVWVGGLMGLVGLVSHYWLLLLLVALASLGSASYHPAGAVIATANSGARRGAGMSIFSVGGSLGSALSPLWIAWWLTGLGAKSTLTLSLVGGLVGFALYAQAQQKSRPHPTPITPAPSHTQQGHLACLLMVVFGAMARSWFQVSLTTYLPVWVQSNGGTLAQGSQMLSVFLFAIGAGSLLGGFISDRIGATGPWVVVLVSTVLISPIFWVFLHASPWLQLLTVSLIGIAIGSSYPTNILLAHDAWPRQVGVASGLVMGIGWAPGGLGASFTGYIADRASLATGLHFLLVPPLIGILCALAYRLFANANRTIA